MNRSLSPLPAAALALSLVTWGCGDAPTSPEALLVTPETQAALEVGESLPRLPDFIAAAGRAGLPAAGPAAASVGNPAGVGAPGAAISSAAGLVRAQALWSTADSLTRLGEDGEAVRREAYEAAVPALVARLDTADLHGLQRRLARWSALAETALRRADLPDLAGRLEAGRALLIQAQQAEAAGDRAGAIRASLLASDRLSATTPRAVAARLTADSEALLSRMEFDSGRSGDAVAVRRLQRADRLVRGAREALVAGDFQLAIRRAFYARELLRGGEKP